MGTEAREVHTASILYVGLDVHKNSIDIAKADAGREGEIRHIGQIGGDLVALDKALRRLISRGHRLHLVYEAGPCGFVIWRHLARQGIDCEVVAHSSIPRAPGQRIKTDRRDALLLARLSRSGDLFPASDAGSGSRRRWELHAVIAGQALAWRITNSAYLTRHAFLPRPAVVPRQTNLVELNRRGGR